MQTPTSDETTGLDAPRVYQNIKPPMDRTTVESLISRCVLINAANFSLVNTADLVLAVRMIPSNRRPADAKLTHDLQRSHVKPHAARSV